MSNKVKIIRASAGSGKTYRLAYEYIRRVVSSPSDYSKILAVTFTNKATEEMKNRILDRLNQLSNAVEGSKVDYLEDLMSDCDMAFWQVKENARRAKSYILHDYTNFAVSTIDAFFQRIARSFFRELNLDFNYQVELSEDSYIVEAVDRVIELSKGDELLSELIENVVNEQIEGNSWDIRKKLCGAAGVISKEGYKAIQQDVRELLGILLKAKEDLNDLRNLAVISASKSCSVIRGAGLSGEDFSQGKRGFGCQLERIAEGDIDKGYNSYFLSALESSENWCSKKAANRAVIYALESDLMPLLNEVKNGVDRYFWLQSGILAVEKNFSLYLLLDYIAIELDRLWGENNKLPIHRTTDLIADITSQSDAPFIYEKIGAHYSTYMIDEFQDTSNKQWSGFKPLIEEALSSSNVENVMLIGDVKQAIYRWRGGDWNILASKVEDDFIERVNDSESLTTNYRSYDNVIEYNNSLFKEIVTLESFAFKNYERFSGLVNTAYKEYVQQPNSKRGGYVEVCVSSDNIAYLLKNVRDLIKNRGYSQRDIAVLVRKRDEGAMVANALVNGGYNVVSDEALLLNNSSVVRFIVSMFKLSLDNNDALSIANVNLYLGYDIMSPLQLLEKDLVNKITLCDPIKALELIIKGYELESVEVSYLQSFYDAVYRFTTSVSGDIGQFIEWWDEYSGKLSLAIPKGQDAITVITIHKAKGLEYEVVLVPFADWGLLPLTNSHMWGSADGAPLNDLGDVLINYVKGLDDSPFREDYRKETVYSHIDNLNLLYVAVTRAGKELYLCVSEDRVSGENVGSLIAIATRRISAMVDSDGVWSLGHKDVKVGVEQDGNNEVFVDKLRIENAVLRVATRLPSYKLEDEEISDRAKGVLMHNIFSKVEKFEDFYVQLEFMENNGDLSKDAANELRAEVDIWSKNEVIKGWFDGSGRLYSERAILSQGNKLKRPDRVVIHDDRVVLVDYKFGQKVEPKHSKQIESYADLIRGMGYFKVDSYLWYVTINQIITL